MNPVNLWLARLFPPLGLFVHAAAVIMVLYGPEQSGYLLILAVWGVTILYCFGVYAGGDFIHRTIGLTPWPKGDSFQTDIRRSSLAFAYWVTISAAAFVLGLNLDIFTSDGLAEADARAIVLELMLGLYAGGVAPTLYLGWRLKPLSGES